MASFASGANAFLSSPYKEKTIGPNPATTRGAALHVYAHPREPRIIYPSGRFIVDPSDCFIYRGHAAPTTVAKFSPNGYWVASADTSGKVRVWSWDNPEHMTKLETPVFSGEVKDLDWDSESKKIVAVGEGSPMMAKVFTWDTGNSVGEMVGHNKRVLSVTYKPSRPFRIMTASEDMRTIFYAGPPFKLDHSNPSHTNFVNCVRYAPSGEKIVSVGSDRKVQLYDGKTGEPTENIDSAHEGSIYSVCFSPDSAKFVTSSADKTLKQWDAASLTCEQTYSPTEGESQLGDMQISVLWCPQQLLSVSLNGNINYFNSSSATPVRVVQGHQVAITAMTVDRAAGVLYSGSFDGVLCATALDTGISSRIVGPDPKNMCGASHTGNVVGLAVLGGSVMSVGWDDTLRTTDAASKSSSGSPVSLNGQPTCIATHAEKGIVLVSTNAEVAVYSNGQKVGCLANMAYKATCVDIVGSGDEVAVGGDDNKTHIYSLNDNVFTEVTTIETRSAVTAVAYSPAGDALAIGDAGRQVEVYERGTWEARVKGRWVFHTSRVTCLSWSPSGAYLASGSLDENIFIWNCAKPTTKIQLQFAHVAGVTGVGWLNDTKLVSVGNDHCIVTWNIPAAEA